MSITVDTVINIATSGRPDLLKRTLDSLGQCRVPAGFVETVVVENGPAAGAEAVVRSAPACLRARYMHVPLANKSASLNAALATLPDCLVFFTDDDTRVEPDLLERYADAARTHGPNHFFGGPVSVDYETTPPLWLFRYLPKSAIGWERNPGEKKFAWGEFLGFNWAAWSSDLRAVGGFNPDRGPGAASGSTGQDSEMQERLIRRGIASVYLPEARVWHYVPKERCSEEWTIQRTFRHGVEEGTRAAYERAILPGLPPWRIVRRCLMGLARSSFWALSFDPQSRFKARHRMAYDHGLLHGIRCEKKARRLKSPKDKQPVQVEPEIRPTSQSAFSPLASGQPIKRSRDAA
jgi:glycosyl transferase family 2